MKNPLNLRNTSDLLISETLNFGSNLYSFAKTSKFYILGLKEIVLTDF